MISKFLKKNIKKISGIALVAVSIFTFINLFNSNNVSFAQEVETCSFLVCSDPTAENADEVTTDITQTDITNPDTGLPYNPNACRRWNCSIAGAANEREFYVYSPEDVSCEWLECGLPGTANEGALTKNPSLAGVCRHYVCNNNEPPALNYDPTLTTTNIDEVGCVYSEVCEDPDAFNEGEEEVCRYHLCKTSTAINDYDDNHYTLDKALMGTSCTWTKCTNPSGLDNGDTTTIESEYNTCTMYKCSGVGYEDAENFETIEDTVVVGNNGSPAPNPALMCIIEGCKDSDADNYSDRATVANNDLCVFTNCQNAGADNYNENENGVDVSSKTEGTINEDESICRFTACMNNAAVNYQQTASGYNVVNEDPSVVTSDASICRGCTDLRADNDGNYPHTDNTQCEVEICQNPIADNYRENAEGVNIDEGSSPYGGIVYENSDMCSYIGCLDEDADNYLKTASGDNLSGISLALITHDDDACQYTYNCHDSDAENYNSAGVEDNSLCVFEACTDMRADNYNLTEEGVDVSTKNYGTVDTNNTFCSYTACMDIESANYLHTATDNISDVDIALITSDESICQYAGCEDPLAMNVGDYEITDNTLCLYDTCDVSGALNANEDLTSSDPDDYNSACEWYACSGVGNEDAINFEELTDTFVGGTSAPTDSCIFEGCKDLYAVNFSDTATFENNTLCVFEACTDVTAANYNETALGYSVSGVSGTVNSDPSICQYAGCTDPSAYNYDIAATQDNNSCYWRYTCEQSGYSNSWTQTTQNEWEVDANCVE